MAIVDKSCSGSPAFVQLDELAFRTKRYGLFEIEPGRFEVIDHRYLLDRLLQFPELHPGTDDLLESQLDEFMGQLSSRPTLENVDMLILAGLLLKTHELAPETEDAPYDVYDDACDSACVLRGSFPQVEQFLLAALDHRVQP